ncbi:MAG: hypothetical protein P8N49_08450 [Opitutales bacterium]|nr:hypothetical protein [Opitutales bacterium]
MSKKDRKNKKILLETEKDFGSSPFSSIQVDGLSTFVPLEKSIDTEKIRTSESKVKNSEKIGQGERLEIRREKSGRGGKTVTTIKPFPSYIGQTQKGKLLKKLKSTLGTGGTWNQQTMELQGDKREEVFAWMESAGFKPVLAGG